jgi:hypothetical protein
MKQGKNKCWRTEKRMYSQANAERIRVYMNKKLGYEQIKATYQCEFCNAYHLTSMAPRIFEAAKEKTKNKKSYHQQELQKTVQLRLDALLKKGKH